MNCGKKSIVYVTLVIKFIIRCRNTCNADKFSQLGCANVLVIGGVSMMCGGKAKK